MNKNNYSNDILERFQNTEKLTEVIRNSILAALKKHKQAGNSVCEWRDDKIVWVQPRDILKK